MNVKRKTLPKDLDTLLKEGDFSAITAVLDGCEPDARDRLGRTALAFAACSDDLSRWLVARGAAVDATDTWGNTALQSRITYGGSIEVLLALGANVQHAGGSLGTPLHTAAGTHKDLLVARLLEAGARIDALDRHGKSPLEVALARVHNATLPALVRTARRLLDAGAAKSTSTAASVKRIGETFEFHRASFNRELLAASSAALDELYALFDATRVAPRTMHDGVSAIVPHAETWQKQHDELWELLVPSRGAAATVQGEVIRISRCIASEVHRNGGANWSDAYRAMARAFVEHLQSGVALLVSDVTTARTILRGCPHDDTVDELMQFAVRWVRWNSAPVALAPPSYDQ